MNTPTTPEQARQIREMAEFTDPSVIISSLAEQVKALTNEVAFFKNAAAKFCTDLAFAESERDAALSASRYETDLCGQALADLKTITADAARYRFIADPCSGAERILFYSRGDFGRGLLSGAMLDAAIDAAMEVQP